MSDVFAPRPGTVVISFHVDFAQALSAVVDEPTRTCAAVHGRDVPGPLPAPAMSTPPVKRNR
jgi:hypothetical protein